MLPSGLVVLAAAAVAAAAVAGRGPPAPEGEFVAGAFILTQKSLDEAPYRYAGVLRRALDKVEAKDPPSKSDEENCDVRYRIRPSGKRSKLRIVEDTLSIVLRENNTVEVAAKLYVEVAAKTWIWKGISFGLLGCLKMSSCKGETVTYSANIDCRISFTVDWRDDEERMAVTIKPVDTVLKDVKVAGCRPPWYLWWFKKWQSLLNEGVQEAFQDLADNYEHMAEVPEEFSPIPGVYVQYRVTGMVWSRDYVLFRANATFSTEVSGTNVTFSPAGGNHSVNDVPMDRWSAASRSDMQSHLLQGVRLSTEFLNSLMWYASVTNVTKYRGDARVLDSQVNGTVLYTPPLIRVQKDDLLSIDIRHGLLLATCKPIGNGTSNNNATREPATLFRAEFYELAGQGKIRLASTSDQTGITVSLDQLDLSKMATKPFEPKLPLPESFENELMKNAVAQLQPVVNNYLRAKPLYLPDNFAPFAASPELRLVETGGGRGYAELTSYCTCSKSRRTDFAVCDPRSYICQGGKRREEEERGGADRRRSDEDEGGSLGDKVKDGLKNVFAFASGIINRGDDDSAEARSADDEGPSAGRVNFTALFEESRRGNISYAGLHLTFYEDTLDCTLDEVGAAAKVYWLWRTEQCTPLYLHGEYLNQFYHLGGDSLKFGCSDSSCKFCEYGSLRVGAPEDTCVATSLGQSYRVGGAPDLAGWSAGEKANGTLVVANVFFDKAECSFYPRYVEPQMVSSHVSLGSELVGASACQETDSGEYLSLSLEKNSTGVAAANWDCDKDCFGCLFRVVNVALGSCHSHTSELKVIFTRTAVRKEGDGGDLVTALVKDNAIVYAAVICSVLFTIMTVGTVAICYRCCKAKAVSPETSPQATAHAAAGGNNERHGKGFKQAFKERVRSVAAAAARPLGNRFVSWKKAEAKDIREDVLQNCMLLLNGALAIVFAVEWNGNNNPLLIIQNKFHSGVAVSVDVLDTSRVSVFVSRLNYLTLAVNVANAAFSFGVVAVWCATDVGTRAGWTKARLLSSATLLAGVFIVIATAIFSTYFDELVTLAPDRGIFLTDNKSMHSIASSVLRVSLNGFSLTVISFTIVFLFHGVGGGLYCGTVLFRLLHIKTRRSNMEILTTLLVILTIIQPFICLHPVIIWSQDSNHNSTFLLLVILIWFLPLGVHISVKAIVSHCRPRCESRVMLAGPAEGMEMAAVTSSPSGGNDQVPFPRRSEEQERCNRRKARSMLFFDLALQVCQLAFFLFSFSLITYHIVNTEFNRERRNLQDFILPAIVSVFFWMASISYFLLSLVLDEAGRPAKKLVFKDQNLEAARNMLRQSLRRRLATMDDRGERRRTLQRHRDLQDAAHFPRGKRQTLPPMLDPGESMRGRRVLPDDTSLVRVSQRAGSDGDDGVNSQPVGSVRDSVRRFELPRQAPPPPKGQKPGRQSRPQRPAPEPPGVKRKPPPPSVPPKSRPGLRDRKPRPSLPPKPPGLARQLSKNAEKYVHRPDAVETVAVAATADASDLPEVEVKSRSTAKVSLDETSGSLALSEAGVPAPSDLGDDHSPGCWGQTKRLVFFLLERREYKDPVTYGWRIKFRRLFLSMGVVLFTCLTVHTTVSTQDFSSKREIQRLLDYAGTNLTWPESGSVLDDVFQLYNGMERTKSYIMIASSLLFWAGLALDFASHFARLQHRKSALFTASRVLNFFGSLAVFAGVIVVGLPDYLEASHLDDICPFCGARFNETVRQVAEFAIGLFFACLFTFQLAPILVTIVPALVRASVLILVHPSLQIEGEVEGAQLRMSILQQVIQFSSLLAFPITFVSMAIVQQYQKDLAVTMLILSFWSLPPLVLMVGLHYTRKYRRYAILLYVYYLYNFVYFFLLLCLTLYAMTPERIVTLLRDMMQEPTFWAGSVAQVFLCNVVISDMLYMTVF